MLKTAPGTHPNWQAASMDVAPRSAGAAKLKSSDSKSQIRQSQSRPSRHGESRRRRQVSEAPQLRFMAAASPGGLRRSRHGEYLPPLRMAALGGVSNKNGPERLTWAYSQTKNRDEGFEKQSGDLYWSGREFLSVACVEDFEKE